MCTLEDVNTLSIAASDRHRVSTDQLSQAVRNVEAHSLRMQLSNPHLDYFEPIRPVFNAARSQVSAQATRG